MRSLEHRCKVPDDTLALAFGLTLLKENRNGPFDIW